MQNTKYILFMMSWFLLLLSMQLWAQIQPTPRLMTHSHSSTAERKPYKAPLKPAPSLHTPEAKQGGGCGNCTTGASTVFIDQADNIQGPCRVCASQEFTNLSNNQALSADDFTVPVGGINLSRVEFFGSGTNAANCYQSIVFQIRIDDNGLPGAVIFQESFVATGQPLPDFDLTLSNPYPLQAGNYWLVIYPVMDQSVCGQWFWVDNGSLNGTSGAFIDFNDLFSRGCTEWFIRTPTSCSTDGNNRDRAMRLHAFTPTAHAGTPILNGSTSLCCGTTTTITNTTVDISDPCYQLAYVISPVADGLLTTTTDFNNFAIPTFTSFANADNSFDFTPNCTDLTVGDSYYITSFIADDSGSPTSIVNCQAFSLNPVTITISSANPADCCPSITPVNDTRTVCSMDNNRVSNWQNQVQTTNMGVVPADATGPSYSAVPIGDTNFPDNALPDGVYTGDNCTPEMENYYAYYTCTNTNAPLDAGMFTLTIYPDISTQANMVVGNNTCCPTFQLDANCGANYTVTNDLDSNGDSPDCSSTTDNGIMTFTVSLNTLPGSGFSAAAACATFDYQAAYRCNPCPTAPAPVDWREDFCVSGTPDYAGAEGTIVVDDPDNYFGGVSFWLDNPPTMPVPNTDFTYNGDGCATEIITVYAFLACTFNNSLVEAGSFDVYLYPDIATQANMIINDGGCCPSLQLACSSGYSVINDLDANGAMPDCSNTFDESTISFTITNDEAPNTLGTCWEQTIVANYNCLECPSVTIDIRQTELFCGSGELNFAGAEASLMFSDPSGTAHGVSFWVDNNTPPQQAAEATVSYTEDGCATDTRIVYAFLECDLDLDGVTDSYVPAGDIEFSIFPDLSNINILNADGCCPSLDFNCTTGYTIINSLDGNGATPDCGMGSGVINFRITNNNAPPIAFTSDNPLGACRENILVTTFDCRVCPTVTTGVNWSETFCVAGNPDYMSAAATVGIADPSVTAGELTFWLDAAGTIPAPNLFNYTGAGCAPDIVPVYVLLGCDRDQDGVVEQQVAAGSFDVTIYPAPRQPVINRTLIDNGECRYEVIPGCPDDVLDVTAFGPLAVVSNAGTVSITVTSGLTGTLCTAPQTFAVPYEACSICPFEAEMTTTNASDGVTPFSLNTTTIDVSGALLPLTYNWQRNGFVRYRATTTSSPIGANLVIQYTNGASWAVTMTDAAGCEVIRSNNANNNEILGIDDYEMQPTAGFTQTTGSIDITVSGGAMPYTYQWFGPKGFTATTEDVMNLGFGWHRVLVTDSSVPQQTAVGFYFVASGGLSSGGFVRGKMTSTTAHSGLLTAAPNPVSHQTHLSFALDETTTNAQIRVYNISGQAVAHIPLGELKAGEWYQQALEVESLASGTYFVELTTETGAQMQTKLVVVK